MDGGIEQFIPIILIFVITVIPAWVVLGRTGKSRWWVILSVLPIGSIVLLWILAFSAWTTGPDRA